MSNNIEYNKLIEELYIEMSTKLLIYARSALGDTHLAEEAVQDTFRIACAKSEQLGQSNNREGWLTNTLKHVISRSQAKFTNLLMKITDTAQTSSEAAVENVDMAMYCTSVLGAEDFELVKHVVIDKRTMVEASSELGISVENCKKRIQRAKKKLKDAIIEDFL